MPYLQLDDRCLLKYKKENRITVPNLFGAEMNFSSTRWPMK